jgi:hypothetical protein
VGFFRSKLRKKRHFIVKRQVFVGIFGLARDAESVATIDRCRVVIGV